VSHNPTHPEELAATIYHALDLPINETNNSGTSLQPTTGKPVMELFG
jgi:hypothetical protein